MPDFPWTHAEWSEHVTRAIRSYWAGRSEQAVKQTDVGSADAGIRGEVTGGLHLDAFCNLFAEVIQKAGFTKDHIKLRTGVELPGYYRPSKKWDVIVVRNGRLCAAIEVKSQVGPSFGNNFNNRSEEAVGSSVDFWLAFREGRLGAQSPWLGYFFLLEEAPASLKRVGITSPAFPADPIFYETSYAQRYEILCRRMVLERNYSAAALVLSPRTETGIWRDAASDLTLFELVNRLYGHLIGCVS